MFDEFVAEVCCPGCSGETDTTQLVMQTHLRDADASSLRVGFVFEPIDLEPSNLAGYDYLLVTAPEPLEPIRIRIADTWHCRKCETEHWAVVEIVGLRLEKIEPITMDCATLSTLNYIGQTSAEGLVGFLLGLDTPADARQLDVVDVLRQRLP